MLQIPKVILLKFKIGEVNNLFVDIKILFGSLAVIISLLGYSAYFISIFSGKTKPHVFSWLIWGIITGVEFFGQVYGHAGAGAWVTGLTAVACTTIAILSVKKGKLDITKLDSISFAGAIISIILWIITKEPTLSVLLGIITDALGYIPTFRKSISHPYEETLITWFLNGVKFAFSLIALEKFTLLSSIYPIYLVISNWTLVGWIIYWRKNVENQKNDSLV